MTRAPRPSRPPRWARIAAVGLTVALAAGGCSLRTAGSPKGDLGLTATFDDVHNLVVGHSVKLADVTIGTVTHVRLDGYRAEVTMSIEDGHPLPVGTTAVLAKTSLLGEQYIELRPPDGSLPTTAGLLHDGDEITRTTTEAEFEEVTERAIEFLGAVTADDLNTIVSTGAQAVGGRGRELNALLRDLSAVVTDLSSQREQIAHRQLRPAQPRPGRERRAGRRPRRRPCRRLRDPRRQPRSDAHGAGRDPGHERGQHRHRAPPPPRRPDLDPA